MTLRALVPFVWLGIVPGQTLAAQSAVSELKLTVDLATGAFIRSIRIPSRSQLASTEGGVCKPARFTAIPGISAA